MNDLLFTSKIRETAKQLALECRKLESVKDVAAATDAQILIIDLRRADALAALDAAAPAIKKIGFIDHERTDVMEAARARGCVALAKGKFSTELPRLLSAS